MPNLMLVLASRPSDSRLVTADLVGPRFAGPSLEGRLRRPWPLPDRLVAASPPLAGRLIEQSGLPERDHPLSTGLPFMGTLWGPLRERFGD